MGNCLITKLKESVNNPDLLKLGEIRLTAMQFMIVTNTNTVQTANNITQGNSYSTNTGYVPVYKTVSIGDVISLPNKYELKAIMGVSGLTIDDMALSPSIKLATVTAGDVSKINMPVIQLLLLSECYGNLDAINKTELLEISADADAELFGTVSSFVNATIKTLTVPQLSGTATDFVSGISLDRFSAGPGVTGDIAAFGSLTNTNEMTFNASKCTGSIESLVEALWSNNKRAGHVIGVHNNGIVTYRNLIMPLNLTMLFSENGVSLCFNGDTSYVAATYNGTTWTYLTDGNGVPLT